MSADHILVTGAAGFIGSHVPPALVGEPLVIIGDESADERVDSVPSTVTGGQESPRTVGDRGRESLRRMIVSGPAGCRRG